MVFEMPNYSSPHTRPSSSACLSNSNTFDWGSAPGSIWHMNMPAVIINENYCCWERHFGKEGKRGGIGLKGDHWDVMTMVKRRRWRWWEDKGRETNVIVLPLVGDVAVLAKECSLCDEYTVTGVNIKWHNLSNLKLVLGQSGRTALKYIGWEALKLFSSLLFLLYKKSTLDWKKRNAQGWTCCDEANLKLKAMKSEWVKTKTNH